MRLLAEVEKDYILTVLRANNGNKARTAEQLQIGPATLYRKLKRYSRTRRVANERDWIVDVDSHGAAPTSEDYRPEFPDTPGS